MESGEGAIARIAAWPARVKEYFGELQGEMRRVTWPSRKQVQSTTGVVLVAIFVFAAYFWIVDLIMGNGIARLFTFFTK